MTIEEAIHILDNLKPTNTKSPYDAYVVGEAITMAIKALKQESVLDKISAEITDCLNALDAIEKSGFNIYLPNEISGRRLTYQQCLDFIDKHKAESEEE